MSAWPGQAVLAPPALTARAADFLRLTKPRVASLISLTAAAGYYLGATGPVDWARLAFTAVATALAGGGALGLNQLLERDLDARMKRTRERPLPAGRLAPIEALAFSAALVTLGLAALTLLVDAVAGLVTAATVVTYLFAYTPLKRRTALCTVVGAVPGALPPLTGWAAASGGLGAGAWALFGILFFWQLPHSLAIARLYRDDYAAAGMKLLPVVDPSGRSSGRQVVLNCLALLGAGIVPTLVGLAGVAYLVVSLALGGWLLVQGWRFARENGERAARRLYLASLLYLPGLLLAMSLDKR